MVEAMGGDGKITMFTYEVPVEAVTKHEPSVSKIAAIKDGLTCNGFEIRKRNRLYIFNKESEEPLGKVIEDVEKILSLLSFKNPSIENFKIVESGIVAAKKVPEEPKMDSDGNKTVELKETLQLREHLGIAMTIVSLDDVTRALPCLDDKTYQALRWFYIGNLQDKQADTFLAHYICLETLMESSAEPVQKVIAKLDEKQQNELMNTLNEGLKKFLDEAGKNRILQHIRDTNLQSENDRYAKALQGIGIAADANAVKELRDLRSAIVHRGERPEDVRAKLDILDGWIKFIMAKKYSLTR